MTQSEFENRRTKKLLDDFVEKRRPPPQLRDRVDVAWRREGAHVELFEIHREPQGMTERPLARASWIKTHRHWRVYWMRASGKWERYPPASEVDRLEEFLAVVDADASGCFWG